MQEALMGLGAAVLLMLTGLVPLLGLAAKTALTRYIESKNREALNGAVETVATKAAAAGASVMDRDVALQIQKVKDRVPDAVAGLGVSDATLRDKLAAALVGKQ
ncbi:hypothetical protein RQ831_18175 [Roseomonas gilardii]|uniref:Uncharacterized protein n=1 Tax=Roseomonas gilardii TaxID=257708 RepID=A0ABU3MJ47_9PROT|nr:hypothetical protein [Roseomonas gilardii]MDT8332983.1 hypothetical protein [Roseomonas gilardii]